MVKTLKIMRKKGNILSKNKIYDKIQYETGIILRCGVLVFVLEGRIMQIETDKFQKEKKEHGSYYFPFLISKERLSGYETGSFLWHWHSAIELTLVTKGQMIYKVNNNTFHLSQGQALFGNAATLHAGYMFNNQDCEYTSVTFEPRLVYGYENSSIYTKFVKPIVQNVSLSAIWFDLSEKWHEEVLNILKDMIAIGTENPTLYELDILIKLAQFWRQMYLHNESLPQNDSHDKANYDRIRSILSYIEENYASKLTLEEIAGHIHLCKSECSRIFKKYMNVALFEFILQYRIEKSLDFFPDKKYSIIDIAEAVGFNDSNYFTKVFRKQKGCSPTKYRKVLQ